MMKTEEVIRPQDSTVYLADYAPPDYAIDELTMLVELDAGEVGQARITTTSHCRRVNQDTESMILNGEKFRLESIARSTEKAVDLASLSSPVGNRSSRISVKAGN